MHLIETEHGEADEDLRSAIDAMLAGLADPPQTDWWHPYELGRTFLYSSRQFREFVCPAGSVMAHLMLHGSKTNLDRALLTTSTDRNGLSAARILANRQTHSIDPALVIQLHDEQT